MQTLALYTTVYPAVEPYLVDWYASVCGQTDCDFDLWIALDGMGEDDAAQAMGREVDAVWVRGGPDETVGSIRQLALEKVARMYDGVVFVDSDDVLHPSRVATAREMLEKSDVAGCALRVIDEQGRSVGRIFTLPDGCAADQLFPRSNVFGLSNSAARSVVLRRCLPIPRSAALVDWFLWTRAWLFGARFTFGERAEMDYRQYGTNTARVLGPFLGRQVTEDAELVRHHYRLVLASDLAGAMPERLRELVATATSVDAFADRMVASPEALSRYVDALNRLKDTMVWWQWVAHPSLRHLWVSDEGEK